MWNFVLENTDYDVQFIDAGYFYPDILTQSVFWLPDFNSKDMLILYHNLSFFSSDLNQYWKIFFEKVS